jgi:plastocyanin
MTRSARHLALCVVAAAALLAACGSSGGSSNGGSSGAATTAAAGGSAAPATGGSAVNIKDFAFNPGNLSVKAGTTVTWTNSDSTTHKIKSGDGSFNSDNLGNGATFEHKFAAAGTFAYICGIHPSMKGTITVTA